MKVDRKLRDDPTLAGRYLADQMSDAEREEFETALLQDPEVAQELEATARMKVGMEKLQESGELEKLVRARPLFEQPAFFAAAASVGVLAIGLVLVRWQGVSEPILAPLPSVFSDESGKVLPVGSTTAMQRVRSDKYDAEIELPVERQSLELRLRPASPGKADEYSVSLARISDDGSTAPVAVLKDLRQADDGFISVFADSALLRPGRYQLTVSDEGSEAPVYGETFVIRVRPHASGSAAPE
jgi:anti-sigma-K factor RskA